MNKRRLIYASLLLFTLFVYVLIQSARIETVDNSSALTFDIAASGVSKLKANNTAKASPTEGPQQKITLKEKPLYIGETPSSPKALKANKLESKTLYGPYKYGPYKGEQNSLERNITTEDISLAASKNANNQNSINITEINASGIQQKSTKNPGINNSSDINQVINTLKDSSQHEIKPSNNEAIANKNKNADRKAQENKERNNEEDIALTHKETNITANSALIKNLALISPAAGPHEYNDHKLSPRFSKSLSSEILTQGEDKENILADFMKESAHYKNQKARLLPEIVIAELTGSDFSAYDTNSENVFTKAFKIATGQSPKLNWENSTLSDRDYTLEGSSGLRKNNTAPVADFNSSHKKGNYDFDEPENFLEVETVLVPKKLTVISSSRDGKISKIHVDNGDRFSRGDVLLEYDCRDVAAERKIAKIEKDFTEDKLVGTERLYELDIISELEKRGIETEDKQAQARASLYEARMDNCVITAPFDGHVTNRLANAGEYTRTDRVLIEVASADPLEAEFLLPSKWLRWINKGAPVKIRVNETGHIYKAFISRIYGEVDPISQSIQMVASLKSYEDPLLPGMSGLARVEIDTIRKAGIQGFLEEKRPLSKSKTPHKKQNKNKNTKKKEGK